MEKDFNWTIAIIAQQEKSNKSEYNLLLNDIIKVSKIQLKVNYIILHFKQEEKICVIETIEFDDFYIPVISQIENSEQKTDTLIDGKSIKEFFNEYVIPLSQKSNRTMLISWGHGNGFGFFVLKKEGVNKNNLLSFFNLSDFFPDLKAQYEFNETLNNLQLLKANTSINIVLKNDHPAFIQGNILSNENVQKATEITDALPATEFAKILQDCFGSQNLKIDVFIANNCYVQLVDVCLAFKETVKIFVASQTVVPFAGIHYLKLFKAISNYSNLSNQEVGKNIVTYFPLKYNIGNFAEIFRLKYDLNPNKIAISAIDLEVFGLEGRILFTEISKLLLEMISGINFNENKKHLTQISLARRSCNDMVDASGFIDLFTFINELYKVLLYQGDSTKQLFELLQKMHALKIKALTSILSSSELFEFLPDSHSGDASAKAPQFFSVFFPLKQGLSLFETKTLTSMNSETSKSGWLDFLNEYLK